MSKDVTVTIDCGTVRGRVEKGVRSFLGIPYAAPAGGENWWREPQPVPLAKNKT